MISDAASRNAEEESRPSRHAVVLVLTAEYFFMPLVAKLIVAVVVGAGATFANGINAFVVAIQNDHGRRNRIGNITILHDAACTLKHSLMSKIRFNLCSLTH